MSSPKERNCVSVKLIKIYLTDISREDILVCSCAWETSEDRSSPVRRHLLEADFHLE